MDIKLKKELEIASSFYEDYKKADQEVGFVLSFAFMIQRIDSVSELSKIELLRKISKIIIEEFSNFHDSLNYHEDKDFIDNLDLNLNQMIFYLLIRGIKDYEEIVLMPLIDRKVSDINKYLKSEIDKNTLYLEKHYWHTVYENLQDIYANVAFDSVEYDPLLILQKLMCSYSLFIQPNIDNDGWMYRFMEDDDEVMSDINIHTCDSLLSLLDEISDILLPVIVKHLKDKETYQKGLLIPSINHDIDIDFVQGLRATSLYEYLSQFDYARVNFFELQYLYFLLNYHHMNFDDPEMIIKIQRWIEYNLSLDNKISIHMNKPFSGLKESPHEVPDIDTNSLN